MRQSSRAARLARLEANVPVRPIRPRLPRNHPTTRFFLQGFAEEDIDLLAEAQALADAGIPPDAWPEPLQVASQWLIACTRAHLCDVRDLLAISQIELTEPPLVPHVYSVDQAHYHLVHWFDSWLSCVCELAKLPWPQNLEQLAEYVEGAIGDTATTPAA